MPTELRVLLIEDDENDALLLLKELEKGGFNPISERVQTATELKARLDEADWDIAITDYVLPEFTGPEALRIIMDHPKDIPCIMVSGKMGEEFAVEAMRNGAQDYILKDKVSRLAPAIQRELQDAISRRKQTESERELEEIQAQYRLVVEGAAEGIFVYDGSKFIFANQGLANMLGIPREEIIGREHLDFASDEDMQTIMDRHRKRMAGEPVPSTYEFQTRDGEGNLVWLSATSSVIEWQGQKAQLTFLSNITGLKELEQELRQANEELKAEQQNLERKNIALSELLERVEHEKKEIEKRLVSNVEHAVQPIIQRLESSSADHQLKDFQLLNEALKEVVSPFIDQLKEKASRLSTRELEVCRMIKSGATTKDIAHTLNLAPTTVSKYREIIRKKLGIAGQEINLTTYLQSLETEEQ